MEQQDRYEIFITAADAPRKSGRPGRGTNIRLVGEHVPVMMSLRKDFVERIDRAAEEAGTQRQSVIRAIIRQAMEDKSEIVTKYARVPLFDEAEG